VIQVLPPPPWPIIDAAKMVDTDCDQVPDALDITITGSFDADKYTFSKVKFVFEGDTMTVTSMTEVDASTIRISFTSPSGEVNTDPTGLVWLYVNVSGTENVSEETYTDGIGPIVLSVSILENLTGASQDSLFVQFSEPVTASTAWMFDVYDSTGAAVTDVPTVIAAKIYNSSKNIWVYVLDATTTQPVGSGMKLQLRSGADVVDMNGNTVDACDFDILTVSVKRHPIPMLYASISDASADTLAVADSVRVIFSRAVDSLHQPDSISVIFGYSSPETLSTTSWTWVDTATAVLNLDQAFSMGKTAGTYSGTYLGNEMEHAGLVIQHKGEGADYEYTQVVAEDKMGPVLLSANYGELKSFDTLRVYFSEPVASVSDSAGTVYLVRKRESTSFIPDQSWSLATDSLTAVYYYTEDATGYITEGDQIRFSPSLSRYVDASGNLPSVDNPWVTVRGNKAVDVEVDLSMDSNVTKAGNGSGYGEYIPDSTEQFRLTILNGSDKEIWDDNSVVVGGLDTNEYKTQGPTIQLDIEIPTGVAYGEDPAWDSVQIDLEILIYTNLGGFVNKFNQTVTLRDGSYLDVDNTLHAQVEWTSQVGKGAVSENGRAVASGAYVGRAIVTTRTWSTNSDATLRLRFDDKKFVHTENWLFGYLRP
ncbi:MAG TPA: hypothetical protein VLM37_12215, partial [Fibrobacteraceae bacterium]|nr:hypothetical protein [Fibrobacteraceae bacterium]